MSPEQQDAAHALVSLIASFLYSIYHSIYYVKSKNIIVKAFSVLFYTVIFFPVSLLATVLAFVALFAAPFFLLHNFFSKDE